MKPLPERNRESEEREKFVGTLPRGSYVHISGVCGTGTGSVAALLKGLGFGVTGSDKAFYPPMGDVVRAHLDKVFEGYSESNLDEAPDLVVIGNNLSRGNPEVERVIRENIPFASMPEVLGALLVGTRDECPTSIVAAGTHGKTTTSCMIATMLDQAGRKPGYFIGGVPSTLPGSIRAVDRGIARSLRCVVLEGDEYDSAFFAKWPKFHSYRPDIVVFTSLEFDHADIYESEAQIALEFTRLARRVPQAGAILLCDAYPSLKRLAAEWEADPAVSARVLFYGEDPGSPFRITRRAPAEPGSEHAQHLTMLLEGETLEVSTTESGVHNAQNALACAAVGSLLGLNSGELQRGLEAFRGVLRRQRVVAQEGGICVIEDFAHHPTAVRLTLDGLRERYPGSRLFAVYEPRSNTSRRSFFQDDYASAFAAADAVYIKRVADAGGYSATAAELTALDVPKLIEGYKSAGKQAYSGSTEEVFSRLLSELKPGDVVVVMSNGDFEGLLPKLVRALKDRFA